MKNLILSAAVIMTLSFNAFANVEPANEKVLITFNQIFKDANSVSWTHTGNFYEAFFEVGAIKTRAILNEKGTLVQTIRYYKESELPYNVLYSVKKEYPGAEVFGVTEVSNKNGINYRIVLKDNKNYIHINANNAGETESVSKFKRGDK